MRDDLGGERALHEIDPVDREARLERDLRRHLHAAGVDGDRLAVAVVERAGFVDHLAGHPALLAGDVADVRRVEVVVADRQRDAGGDRERPHQPLEIVGVADADDVAVRELDC